MRWLCLGVAATLAIFMLSLVRLSWKSDEQVQIAIAQDKATPKPATWESFPFLERYYGGVRALVPFSSNVPEYPRDMDETPQDGTNITAQRKREIMESTVFDPYSDYKSTEYVARYGQKVDCYLDDAATMSIPKVRIYEAIPSGFPQAVIGSNEMLGIRHDVCYDRFGRLGPYGLGYSLNRGGSGAQQEGEREGADAVWQQDPEVDFRQVRWAEAQERCAKANAHRFADLPARYADKLHNLHTEGIARRDEAPSDFAATPAKTEDKVGRETLPRTAVVIRTWWDYPYTPEDLIYLRSIVSELALLSGGEYHVHFLVQVKDDNAPIWSDDETHERILHESLPEEFRGMGTLWSERQMGLMYGGLAESFARGLPVHGVYRSTFMPMQYFAYQHPEYDFFWNWEMDIRNTGHWYDLFDKVAKWSKAQPRKLLWERNARFYVPSEHGTYEDFSQMVRIQTEHGTNSVNNLWSGLHTGKSGDAADGKPNAKIAGDKPVWGPERPIDEKVAFPDDALPPTSFDKDKYTWGVGEEADLITFNPLFDPDGTDWLLEGDVTGYDTSAGPPPRRTAIITASRLSRTLLMTMHRETALNRHTMFSEMWPGSVALHHGLKAVYAPHSVYIDRKWPMDYLQSVFNAGRNGASGGARTSVWGESRNHNFRGTTWFYNAGFPEVLWHRWLGMKIHNGGGEQVEINGEGRMCLPPMLLHPVKRVELVQEGRKADE